MLRNETGGRLSVIICLVTCKNCKKLTLYGIVHSGKRRSVIYLQSGKPILSGEKNTNGKVRILGT